MQARGHQQALLFAERRVGALLGIAVKGLVEQGHKVLRITVEHGGHEELQQRVHLAQVVLHRRACQQQAPPEAVLLQLARQAARRVLDAVRLIHHQVGPLDSRQPRHVLCVHHVLEGGEAHLQSARQAGGADAARGMQLAWKRPRASFCAYTAERAASGPV